MIKVKNCVSAKLLTMGTHDEIVVDYSDSVQDVSIVVDYLDTMSV